jgi:hypothetical protein
MSIANAARWATTIDRTTEPSDVHEINRRGRPDSH